MNPFGFAATIYSRDGIIRALRDYELDHGDWPTRRSWDAAHRGPSSRTIVRYFDGSWRAALTAAGAA